MIQDIPSDKKIYCKCKTLYITTAVKCLNLLQQPPSFLCCQGM